ncbi:Conserved hypothetical protein 95 [Ekhidna lutea]|uniref:Uncharacterized protein n=1 Tax=Ekhidna lutea TaxID=447679 RepID=A0A239FD40_EKHLU|nr:class I SAM-dependent methyltransferase [Ekhidna lutea]SNS54675.1 Conserved hypothetical protein 95 [Ekhidna lutea]
MNSKLDFLVQPEVRQFIRENVQTDTNKLILNPPSGFKPNIKQIVAQIQARQKATGKLDIWASNFGLVMPPPLSIEQASSQTTCDYKKQLISGHHLIDLTGGMGIDCLTLSESFDCTTYVEQQTELCEVFQHNLKMLGKEIEIENKEAGNYLKNLNPSPENRVIYLDPARRDSSKNRVFRIEDCSPNIVELMPWLKRHAHKVLIKFSPILDIQSILNAVPHVSEVHIVSVKNDCKEILIVADFAFKGEPEITCVNLESTHPPFSFKFQDEARAKVLYGEPSSYLFESNSSIMKAGAFKSISVNFDFKKIGESTHLYTSEKLMRDFPGRTFEIIEEASKKNISAYASKGKINVITRNYPLPATELKKKWKLKDGGDYYLLAFRDVNYKPKTLIAKRLDL